MNNTDISAKDFSRHFMNTSTLVLYFLTEREVRIVHLEHYSTEHEVRTVHPEL